MTLLKNIEIKNNDKILKLFIMNLIKIENKN